MKIQILGSGQDAGIPQIGCYCPTCKRARRYKRYRRLGPSIALLDKGKGYCYLIDASPDIKYQIDMLKKEDITIKRKGKLPISGILLTHAHLGHCSGLWYFGREATEERNLPVFCTSKMRQFLIDNYPFNLLIRRKNIKIKEVFQGKAFKISGIKCIPIEVPHRNKIADTVGYRIQSQKNVLYIPDVDYWTDKVIKEIDNVDIAIIDGTFFTKDELPRFRDVRHPPIEETIKLLEHSKTKIYFTHINHSNPINWNRKEKKYIKGKGFHSAFDGLVLNI